MVGRSTVMFATPTHKLRAELLAQKGIGPETADSILLYAGHHPVFVVDAYTRRVLGTSRCRGALMPSTTKFVLWSERALQREKPLPEVQLGLSIQNAPSRIRRRR